VHTRLEVKQYLVKAKPRHCRLRPVNAPPPPVFSTPFYFYFGFTLGLLNPMERSNGAINGCIVTLHYRREALSWAWTPRHCQLRPVNASRFGGWLGQRTLVSWGDSLSAQAFFSLLLMLGEEVRA